MLKLSRLADYGVVLMSYLAAEPDLTKVYTAKDLAQLTQLPLPTVGKLLKALLRAGLLVSQRGVRGGYSLKMSPLEISVLAVIKAIDGPLSLTMCSQGGEGAVCAEGLLPRQPLPGRAVIRGKRGVAKTIKDTSLCELALSCPVRVNWQKLNQALQEVLVNLRLADMVNPLKFKERGSI